MSHWSVLACAGLLEIVFALALKHSRGLSNLPLSLLAAVSMLASLGLLALAMRSLPVGLAYAVWTGIGALGTAVAGIWLLGEPASALKLISLALILAGLIGLKLSA